jgi:hypothetical protein
MKKTLITILLAVLITGCVGKTYVPESIKTTPNTIPEKTESIKQDTLKSDKAADTIEAKRPELKPEVKVIKESNESIRSKSEDIKSESIVHDTEKQKLTNQLQELTIVVKQLQDLERERKLDEARNIKYGVIALFALSAIGFIWYGFSIPGTGYTMLGAVMAVITVVTSIVWGYLEQHPLLLTGLTVFLGISAVMMYLVKREKNKNPLGFE